MNAREVRKHSVQSEHHWTRGRESINSSGIHVGGHKHRQAHDALGWLLNCERYYTLKNAQICSRLFTALKNVVLPTLFNSY